MRKYINKMKETAQMEMPHKFPGLDGAKGLLVLMVVLTHCLPQSMILYFMYFFHMPLFMAISGFLVKISTFGDGYSGYLKRMWSRLIIPWMIAWVIFLPFRLNFGSLNQLDFIDIVYPYYHLWYIPSFLLGSFLCYSILRWHVPYQFLLAITALISIGWYLLYRDTNTPVEKLPLYWLGDKRIFSYLFFFIFGFTLRNKILPLKFSLNWVLVLLLVSFCLVAILIYFHQTSLAIVWPYMLFNIALVVFVLIFIAPNDWLQQKILLFINNNSLGIYLYHPLIQLSIYNFVLKDRYQQNISNLVAIIVFIAVLFITIGLIWLLKRWKITDRYMLGNIHR